MAMQEYKLPDPGEGLTEAEIVQWMVKPGDTVKINDIIVEVETAKSLVELPTPYAGTVAELLVEPGQTVEVGTPIIAVAPEGESIPAAPEPTVEKAADDQPVEPGMVGGPVGDAAPDEQDEPATPTLVGYGPRKVVAKRRARKSSTATVEREEVNAAFSTAGPTSTASKVATEPLAPEVRATMPTAAETRTLAKPPVRKLAKDLGIDLSTVSGSGEGGVVTRADVEDAAEGGPTTAAVAPVVEQGGETRIPIKGVRKMTAQAMVSSAFTAPHVTEWLTVDVTRTMDLVHRLKSDRRFDDVKVSPLLLVAKAVCLAARRTPEINSAWDEAAQEIVLKSYVNLGIAAATPRGLVVPNVPNAEQLSLHDLAESIGELTATARAGRTQPAQMSGGTFTITNVGVFGIDAGTPILNPGESAILAFGAVNRRPWVVGDDIVPRWVTTLAISFDHRLVDGEQGSKFLADVGAILEDPATAMMF